MELIRSRKGHLRRVGTGLELVREGLGRNPSRASCESKGDDDWFLEVNGSVKLGQKGALQIQNKKYILNYTKIQ